MKKPKKNVTIDRLATMVAKGFENMATSDDIARLERDMARLHRSQEDIILKLDNVAYRFELVELQKRVELLENAREHYGKKF